MPIIKTDSIFNSANIEFTNITSSINDEESEVEKPNEEYIYMFDKDKLQKDLEKGLLDAEFLNSFGVGGRKINKITKRTKRTKITKRKQNKTKRKQKITKRKTTTKKITKRKRYSKKTKRNP